MKYHLLSSYEQLCEVLSSIKQLGSYAKSSSRSLKDERIDLQEKIIIAKDEEIKNRKAQILAKEQQLCLTL